jgi:GAF domain-containing protein/HAMP domain-containing protein
MVKDRYSALSKLEQRIFWIVLILSLTLGVFGSTLLDTLFAAPSFQYALVNSIPLLLAVISFSTALLIFLGKKEQGAWLILIGTSIGLVLAVSQAEGYGYPSAFILTAITLFIPLQVLKGRKAVAALGLGIIATLAIILLDTFWSGTRVPAFQQDVISARVASIVLGLIIVTAVVLQYRELSIRGKLLILAVGTSLISIVVVVGFSTYFSQKALAQDTHDALILAARHTMSQVDALINFHSKELAANTQIPALIDFLKASPEQQKSSQADVLALLNALAQSDPVNIGSYALLDKNGIDLVDTYTADVGIDKSNRDYFIVPITKGVTLVSPVRFSPTSADRGFYIGTPIVDNDGTIVGVLRVRIRASILEKILQDNNEFAGKSSFGVLLDDRNIVVASGKSSDWNSRTLTPLDQNALQQLLAENRIKNAAANEISLEMPGFARSLQNLSEDRSYFSSADAAWGEPVEVGVIQSPTNQWKVAYVEPQSIAFESIVQQRQIITLIALLTSILIALAGFMVANTIIQPIASLASTAEQIAQGDFSARARVSTRDELGALAQEFNRMTERLKDILGSLERRVAERTADVEMARLLSERRAQELESISEISSLISSEQRLDVLLPLITRLVSERFDFYHVGIFFIDRTKQYAELQAANSEGGKLMLARGHRLEVGHTGIVGNVAKTGQARIALDVGADAVYFDNPDLPQTRSEMALPLHVRGETIGVIDIQSTKPGVFTENDAKTLSILADQIAIAIDNARLFGQNKQALEELQSLYNQYLRQEWKTFFQNRQNLGYMQSLTNGQPLEVALESDDIQRALENGHVVVGTNDKSIPTMAIPVKLRGQTIGVMRIQAPTKNRRWNQDEINLAQAISDRLALALDNARLLFVSQRQTAKEQKVSEVTAKIGASINMRNVLQTAVEELGRALPGSEVIIQFQNDQNGSAAK